MLNIKKHCVLLLLLTVIMSTGGSVAYAGGGGSSGGSSGGGSNPPGTGSTPRAQVGTVAVTPSRTLANEVARDLNSRQNSMCSGCSATVTTNRDGTVSVSVRQNDSGGGSSGGTPSVGGSGNPITSNHTIVPATGYFDVADSGSCTVAGWAYDPDNSAAPIDVHIYRDGPAGSGTFVMSCTANSARPDVNSVMRIPGNHGFVCTLPDSFRTMTARTLYIHAIDLSGRPNQLLRTNGKSINCSAAVVPVNTLQGADCTIAANQSTCNAVLSWNLGNVASPAVRNITTNVSYPNANQIVSNTGHQITYGANIIRSMSGTTVLRQITVTGRCPSSAPWDSSRGVCYNSTAPLVPLTVSITTQSPLVRKLSRTDIRWQISAPIPAGYTCSMNGPGLTNVPVTTQTGSMPTPPIENTSVYTLTCSDGVTQASDTVTVEIIPEIQEV
jgi:hypothetical protein